MNMFLKLYGIKFFIFLAFINFLILQGQDNFENENDQRYHEITGILSKPCQTKEEALKSVFQNACIEFASYIEVIVENRMGYEIIETRDEIKDRFRRSSELRIFPIKLHSLERISYIFEQEKPYIAKADYRMEREEIELARNERRILHEEVLNRIKSIKDIEEEKKQDYCLHEICLLKSVIVDNLIFHPIYNEGYINNKLREISFIRWLQCSEKNEESKIINLKPGNRGDHCQLNGELLLKNLLIFIIDNSSIFQIHPLPDGSTKLNLAYTYKENKVEIGLLFIYSSILSNEKLNGEIINDLYYFWSKNNSTDFFDWYDKNFHNFDYVNYYNKSSPIEIRVTKEIHPLDCEFRIDSNDSKKINKILQRIRNYMKNMRSEKETLCFQSGTYSISKPLKIKKKSISLISTSDFAVFSISKKIHRECIQLEAINKPISISNLEFELYDYRIGAISIKNTETTVNIENCNIYSYNRIEKPLIKIKNSPNVEVINCNFIQKNVLGFIEHVYKIEKNTRKPHYYVGTEIELLEEE